MASYRVKAGAVVAVIGGSDRYLERGVVLPEGVENIDHLKAVGLVEEVAPPETGEPARGGGVDLDALNLDELRAYAAENGIDIGDATRKADIRAAIDASRA